MARLEECEPPCGRRNTTPASDAAEEALRAFAASGLRAARLDPSEWGLDAPALYGALWRACSKRRWRSVASAHKEGGEVYLVRKD